MARQKATIMKPRLESPFLVVITIIGSVLVGMIGFDRERPPPIQLGTDGIEFRGDRICGEAARHVIFSASRSIAFRT